MKICGGAIAAIAFFPQTAHSGLFIEDGHLRENPTTPSPQKLDLQLQELDDLCANGEPLEAIDACSEAIQRRNCHEEVPGELAPSCALLFDNLGAVLEQTGNYEEALVALNYAAQLQPNDANIQYNLGVVYVRLQRYEAAIAAFEEATRLNPNDTQARKQAELLRELID